MQSCKNNKQNIQTDAPETGLGIGNRIAPAVALLLLGDSAYAIDSTDDDGAHIPEPSVLALLAAGAVVGGAAKYLHNKRRKK